MKANTVEKIKFRRLVRRLKEPVRSVVGILELLWQATAKNAPRGDIGQFTDEEIAILCDWDDEPEILICALIETGWIDRCSQSRLIVHDWDQHCPSYIKGALKSQNTDFANVVPIELSGGAKPPAKPLAKPPASTGGAKPPTTYPILSNPIHTTDENAEGSASDLSLESKNSKSTKRKSGYTEDFELYWSIVPTTGFNKAAAFTRWKQAIKSTDPKTIIDSARIYAKSKKVLDGFPFNPANWLSGKLWETDWAESQPAESSFRPIKSMYARRARRESAAS